MYNVLDLTRLALLNDEDVVAAVEKTEEGFPLIDFDRTVAGKYPQLELHQEYGNDLQFADDSLYTQRSVLELNYYCRFSKQYNEAIPHIRRVLRRLGFTITNSYSMKDRSTGIIKYAHQFQLGYSIEYIERLYEQEKAIFDDKYPYEERPLRGTFYDPTTEQWITF